VLQCTAVCCCHLLEETEIGIFFPRLVCREARKYRNECSVFVDSLQKSQETTTFSIMGWSDKAPTNKIAIKRPRTRSTAARQVSNTHERDLVTNQNVLIRDKISFVGVAHHFIAVGYD